VPITKLTKEETLSAMKGLVFEIFNISKEHNREELFNVYNQAQIDTSYRCALARGHAHPLSVFDYMIAKHMIENDLEFVSANLPPTVEVSYLPTIVLGEINEQLNVLTGKRRTATGLNLSDQDFFAELELRLINGDLDPRTVRKITDAVSDSLSINWSTEDIISKALDDHNVEITTHEALKMLAAIDHNHDCEQGVTWYTVDFHIDQFIQDKAKEEVDASSASSLTA